MNKNDIVIISRPAYTQGGWSHFQDKMAVVKDVKGNALSLKFAGDPQLYLFWVREVDRIYPAG